MTFIKPISFLFLTILITIFSAGCQKSSKPGIYINEFLTSNSSVNADNLNYKHVDWIELYNAYDSTVNIGGYYLTDKRSDTTKWIIPEGTKINPDEYLIVWADRLDTALHTNFKLNRSKGQIALFSNKKNYSTTLITLYKSQIFRAEEMGMVGNNGFIMMSLHLVFRIQKAQE